MKTFILIHGSWHSSWNWHRVIPALQKQGHKAIAIDLPGMGRDKTPIQQVKMQTTVEKICKLIAVLSLPPHRLRKTIVTRKLTDGSQK